MCAYHGILKKRTMNLGCCSSFSCQITDSNVAPRFCIADVSGEAGELTWAHCYLCQFRGACIICVPSLSFGQTSSSVGGCLRLWVVVGHCLCFLTGHGGGSMVVGGGVWSMSLGIMLWLSLVALLNCCTGGCCK